MSVHQLQVVITVKGNKIMTFILGGLIAARLLTLSSQDVNKKAQKTVSPSTKKKASSMLSETFEISSISACFY